MLVNQSIDQWRTTVTIEFFARCFAVGMIAFALILLIASDTNTTYVKQQYAKCRDSMSDTVTIEHQTCTVATGFKGSAWDNGVEVK